jgi:hypothetical protein
MAATLPRLLAQLRGEGKLQDGGTASRRRRPPCSGDPLLWYLDTARQATASQGDAVRQGRDPGHGEAWRG